MPTEKVAPGFELVKKSATGAQPIASPPPPAKPPKK